MRTQLHRSLMLLPLLSAFGCKEYYSVDEACHPKGTFRGDDLLTAGEVSAVDRWNCHRRLVGFERIGINDLTQEAGKGVGAYALENPDLYANYFRGLADSTTFIDQQPARPAFSGVNVWERLDQVDYRISEVTGTWAYELIGVFDEEIAGEAIIDAWFSVHFAQEFGITPSVYDAAYHETELPAEWWQAAFDESGLVAGVGSAPPIPTGGKLFYALVLSDAPPIEGASEEPISYPKVDQIDVPLSGPLARERLGAVSTGTAVEEPEIFSLSYPVSVGYISALQGLGTSSATNPYGFEIINASIQANNVALDVLWVSPEEATPANHNLEVDGLLNKWMGSIYAKAPFEPNTVHTVFVDYTSVDGPASTSFSFTTGSADSAASARSAGPSSAPLMNASVRRSLAP
jgi:hypothetical protein